MKRLWLIWLCCGGLWCGGLVTPVFAKGARGFTLAECYRHAIARSEALAGKAVEIEAAVGRYQQSLAGALPHLTAKASEFIQDTSGVAGGDSGITSSFVRRDRGEVTVNLRQPLFQGFREFRSLVAARADREQQRLVWERARQLLYADVAEVFFTIIELEDDLALLASQERVLQQRLDELRERVQLGQSREGEALSTEAQRAVLIADRAAVRARLVVARETLAFFTGLSVQQRLIAPRRLTVPGWVAQAVTRAPARLDVLAAGEAVKLATARRRYETGGYFPQVNLEANYYPYREGFQSEIDWDVLFSVSLPIFDGGLTRGKVREARARVRQAELARQEAARRAELEIAQAVAQYQAARVEARALQGAVAKAWALYDSNQQEYRLGLVSNLDVLQSLRDYYEIKRRAGRAAVQVQWQLARVRVATGDVLDDGGSQP